MTTHQARYAQIETAFRDFAGHADFSCLAARGVVGAGRFRLGVYGALGSERSTRRLARDLRAFVSAPSDGHAFRSFVAVFPARMPRGESHFEQALWRQLELLSDCDDPARGWDPAVSDDPEDPRFAFSFGGTALFVIGMHPESSRLARRFRWSTLVFNPHAQFDRLRTDGHFDRLRNLVRDREVALQGSLNPNLADFGERSEARQYSGRAAEQEWRCPFHRRAP
jgi:hypothetical protein